jgi:uncharacterized protein (DUF885 family)
MNKRPLIASLAAAACLLPALLAAQSQPAPALKPATLQATPAAAPAANAADAAVLKLADEYFDSFFLPTYPTAATVYGIHRYDAQLEDYSKASIDRQVAALHGYLKRFEALPEAGLSDRVRGDRELMIASIQGTLLGLETIKGWQKNPDNYPSGITGSAYSIMQRDFAPAAERLKLLIAREQAMPAALAAGRANLVNPPKIYTEIAIEQIGGAISFFRNDLPLAFKGVSDAALQAQFAASNATVIKALEGYQAWMKSDLLPRSGGEFRLGAETYRAKLRYDEMVDTPLDGLLKIGMADLRRNQAEFARVAKQLEPTKTTAQVLEQLSKDYPPPAQLLASFRQTFDGITQFIKEQQIITVPSDVRPILRETPPFMRATTFASMDTPGPYEPKAQEAFFNVTLPDPAWSKQRTAGFMAQFNFPVISNVAVHEAYPGHYIQFLWMHRVDDRVRKLIGAASNAEGWAHYCEQMMLDEGFGQPGHGGKDARAAQMLRLGQLQDALLRDARYVVGIRMHTQGMSMEDAIQFFVKEGYQSKEVGETETKRGTGDPTYLYYTLGKLQILKLRADLQAKQGKAFSLKAFHDQFMQQGFAPIRIVRRTLLGDDSPTL